MKIYIASHDRELAEAIAKTLHGHEIVSRWHSTESRPCGEWAIKDLEDVDACDVLVSLASFENVPGGKHVELGYALGIGKKVIHWCRIENIFHYHPAVIRADKICEIQAALDSLESPK